MLLILAWVWCQGGLFGLDLGFFGVFRRLSVPVRSVSPVLGRLELRPSPWLSSFMKVL